MIYEIQAIMRLTLFLDSSALISAIINQNAASPMQRIVALGERKVLDLRISAEVEGDAERFIRKRSVTMLPIMSEIIVKGNIATTLPPNQETIDLCVELVGHVPDARILAAAIEAAVDVLVTHDKTHLVGNGKIKPPEVELLVRNPEDALDWCGDQWLKNRST